MQALEPSPSLAMWRRVAPMVAGGALAGAAFLVATNDPSAPGSRFPACQFRAVTGLWCPGCGLTRGFHELFTGDPISAVQHNLFVPVVLTVAVVAWWSWLRSAWGRPPIRLPRSVQVASTITLPAALVVYGVLRNVPLFPFRSLAP